MICKECGAKLSPEQTICPRCGALQPQAIVPKQKRKKQAKSQQIEPNRHPVQPSTNIGSPERGAVTESDWRVGSSEREGTVTEDDRRAERDVSKGQQGKKARASKDSRNEPAEQRAVRENSTPQVAGTEANAVKQFSDWKDRLTIGGVVFVTLAALIWLIVVLSHSSGSSEPETTKTIAEIQTTTTSATTTVTTTTTTVETTYVTPVSTTDDGADPIEVVSGIVWDHKRAINLFSGYTEQTEAYAEILNQYHQDLGDSVRCYSILAPTNASFYTPEEFAPQAGSSEKDCMDAAAKVFDGVTPIDAYGVLSEHTDEPIYARTDHHWFQLGAYYVAREFAEEAGVPFADLTTYQKTVKEGYVGSMAYYTDDYQDLVDSPEDFVYYTPSNSYTTTYYDTSYQNGYEADLLLNIDDWDPSSWYLVFMCGDEKIVHIETDCDNDRTLVIFKDSYGNALVPCLTSSFSEIYVCDMRYFDLNSIEFIEGVGATDLLFCMNLFSANGSNGQDLEVVRTQSTTGFTLDTEETTTEESTEEVTDSEETTETEVALDDPTYE